MNITKYYPRIVKALYETPWFILPSAHEILRKGFEAHLNGAVAEMPMDPMDDEDEDEDDMMETPMEQPALGLIQVEGVIGKRLGMLEQCMGGCDVDNIMDQLDALEKDPNVQEILFYFNTPGGTVTGVPELAEKIAEVAKKKKCTAYVDVLCASAGYYLASQCSQIYAAPSAEIGSVGVYSLYMDQSVQLANEGIKVNAISAGKFKLAGAPFKPMTDEERAMFQKDVDRIYEEFKAAVKSSRPIDDEDLQGQVFSGTDMITKGFIDGHVNSLSELVAVLTTKTQNEG